MELGAETAVYVVKQAGTKFLKVGVAADPEKRLAALQTSNPHPLHLAHAVFLFGRMPAEQVEFFSHRLLGDHHIRGEWFSCPVPVAVKAVNKAVYFVKSRRMQMPFGAPEKRMRDLGVSL